jgi:hypothetical protein
MGRGIQVPFTLNPREFISGLRTVETGLEGLTAELADLERKSNDALGGIGDGADDAARGLGRVDDAAREAAARVDRDLDRAADDAERAFSRFGRSASADMDKVGRAARDVDDDLALVEDEANQSAKEFGAAFRGDPVEALEEVQSYLSEIVAQKLPGFAGAMATIAGGAVLGLVIAGVEKWREKQEEIRQLATDYLTVIRDEIDPGLRALGDAYGDLIDKQLTLAVLEEASAAQWADLALLASARGDTVEEYVRKTLTGEVTTQEQLATIESRRAKVADEILAATRNGSGASAEQLGYLQQQDAALTAQAEALRASGDFLNTNVKATRAAKDAQAAVARATAESYERQRFVNRATSDTADSMGRVRRSVDEIDRAIDRIPDSQRKVVRVTDEGTLADFNRRMAAAVRDEYKTVWVTERRRDEAWASRAPRDNP